MIKLKNKKVCNNQKYVILPNESILIIFSIYSKNAKIRRVAKGTEIKTLALLNNVYAKIADLKENPPPKITNFAFFTNSCNLFLHLQFFLINFLGKQCLHKKWFAFSSSEGIADFTRIVDKFKYKKIVGGHFRFRNRCQMLVK